MGGLKMEKLRKIQRLYDVLSDLDLKDLIEALREVVLDDSLDSKFLTTAFDITCLLDDTLYRVKDDLEEKYKK